MNSKFKNILAFQLLALVCLSGCTNNYQIGLQGGGAQQANAANVPNGTSNSTPNSGSGSTTTTTTTGTGGTPGTPGSLPISTPISSDSLSVTASPAIAVKGTSSLLTVVENGLSNITYSCVSVQTGLVLSNGNVDPVKLAVSLVVNEDTLCTFQGMITNSVNATPVTAQVNVGVNCANQIKVGGQCQDFACKTLVTLTNVNDLMAIPARSADGVCYAYKLMDAIANGSSKLTTTVDSQVISRDHDATASNPELTHNPYEMGLFQGQYNLLGARVVKLSGGPSATANILVDNFVLMGVYPTAAGAPADLTKAYQVLGTSDSSIADAQGADTHSISFMNQLIPVVAFATGGTSSVTPVDVTLESPPNVPQTIDIRALDCGGSRQLSDIYILFQ